MKVKNVCKSESISCDICKTVIYRTDYLPTHMLLKHSNERFKLKCPFKTCEKMFGQVKNFIPHYMKQHNVSRAVAKKVAGKHGMNLEKIVFNEKDVEKKDLSGKNESSSIEGETLGFIDDDTNEAQVASDTLKNCFTENSHDTSSFENEEPLDLSIRNDRKDESIVHSTGFNESLPLDLTVKKNEVNVVEISDPTDYHQTQQASFEGIIIG